MPFSQLSEPCEALKEVIRLTRAEAFLVCRGFDPSILPLPESYSADALAALEKQATGTITLDSLSHLVSPGQGEGGSGRPTADWSEDEWRRWEVIKGWLGTGSLK